MKITNLASGSKGNSTLIELNNKNILIDIGLPLSNLEKRLGRPFPKIDILLITHTHTDHIKGIKTIVRKQNPRIYTLENELQEKVDSKKISNESEIIEDDLYIKLFNLSHDVPCSGVYLKYKDKELVYITDTGYIKDKIIKEYQNKDIYIIESNYEEELLRNGKYPYHLKQRIRSDRGHISNEDSCKYLKKLIGNKTKHIALAHLSEENNTPEAVEERINKLLKEIKYKPKKTILNQENINVIEV
ncbi:MAG: MBL fold metallo-hydrolase [Bacilli bacterium]|nr:MBL fold metallo-hydrolase [Bacilli bacterium]